VYRTVALQVSKFLFFAPWFAFLWLRGVKRSAFPWFLPLEDAQFVSGSLFLFKFETV
jgi:hypothetical protein